MTLETVRALRSRLDARAAQYRQASRDAACGGCPVAAAELLGRCAEAVNVAAELDAMLLCADIEWGRRS